MKKSFTLFVISALLLSSCCTKPEIGKSMGRWTNFGPESMIENKQGGLDYIEVTMNNVINRQPEKAAENAERIMADILASGLKVWSVHLPYSRTLDISVLNDSLRAENVRFMQEMMRVAAVFGPKYLVLHPSSEPIAVEEREQRLRNSHISIGELAPVAKEIGAVLCVENLPRTCLGQNGQEMMRLIEGYDEVGLCFDTNHLMFQSHEDYLNSIEPGKIKTVHLSDYDFVHESHWRPGQGLIEWHKLWNGIRDNGYDGIMMFECYGEPEQLKKSRDTILDRKHVPVMLPDSVALAKADWTTTELENGAIVGYTQTVMFSSMQSISVVKYPAANFKTAIVHCPGDQSDKVSTVSKKENGLMSVNGSYFDVKTLVPTAYCRVGEEVISKTRPSEVYRVDGVVAVNETGNEVMVAKSDTASYEKVAGDWYSVMAAGPVLMIDGQIVVSEKVSDNGTASVAKDSDKKESGIRMHYSNSQFYDNRHPRAAIGTDDEGNVYYVVIDGRFKGQGDGATVFETAYICSMLGMTDALNLDGGGTSTLWTSETGVVNHPYDNKQFDHKGERTVPNLIMAY